MSIVLASASTDLQAPKDGAGVSFGLQTLKHRLATSAAAGPISSLRSVLHSWRTWAHPELGLLHREGRMMDQIFARLIRPDWNCLDVGAHLGSVSYQFSRLAPNGSHAMIEASPDKAAMLARRFPDTPVLQVAVSDQAGQVSFFENLDAPGYSSLANRQSRGRVREITVPARRIDDLFGPDQGFDLIKIDVEGFEYQALKGAEAMLRNCRPAILFEAGALDDEDVDASNYDALFDLLTADLGYEIYGVFDLCYRRPPISAETFQSYRTYPFLAFNYVALHPGIATPTQEK